MFRTGGLAERHYEFQGASLTVASKHPGVAAAVDYRLRDFRVSTASEDYRLEFLLDPEPNGDIPKRDISAADRRASMTDGQERRPVYDTPAGSVFYRPATDALDASFGGVQLYGEMGRGLMHIRSARYEPEERYLAAHPLTMIILGELLKRRGRYGLHAACVANGTTGALVAGPSGTGKSTLVLALAKTGLAFLSDDMVFLDHGGSGVEAYGFSDAIGVTQDTAARFQELADLASRLPPTGFRKHLIRIEERFGIRGADRCRPAFLIFPELAPGHDSALEAMEPQEAWLRLVPDVLVTHPTATQAHLAAIAELTKQVSCYRLRSGRDVNRSAELIGALLR